MHIDPCDHMSNTGSDVSVSIPQPAPLQSNGSGYNTMQWECVRGRRAHKGSVQSLRENTRWECMITYINNSCSTSQVILGSSGIIFFFLWQCQMCPKSHARLSGGTDVVQRIWQNSYSFLLHWHWVARGVLYDGEAYWPLRKYTLIYLCRHNFVVLMYQPKIIKLLAKN